MKVTCTRRVVVESGGTGVVDHVGLHALESFADRLGLGRASSWAIPWRGSGIPVHHRGKVLVQMALTWPGVARAVWTSSICGLARTCSALSPRTRPWPAPSTRLGAVPLCDASRVPVDDVPDNLILALG